MSDDHFQVIQIAQNWLEGQNTWFNEGQPVHRSLLYPGLHYFLFYFLKILGITDPQSKMFIVRFLHAGYSLLIVIYGYKITELISNKKNAAQVGLILAMFWILPFMSVRNLIEVVCIPPLLIGIYYAILADKNQNLKLWLLSGLIISIGFVFRFQTILIIGGVGLVLLYKKDWRVFLYYTSGVIIGIFLIQGLIDWVAWGYPFASIYQYILVNIENRYHYSTGPWYRYILTILGILIPPVSIMLIYGFFRGWKNLKLIFWPVFLFFLLHSIFPNKQERFILPILPFIIILGVIGWNDFLINSSFWKTKLKTVKGFWIWFWILNSVLLIIFSTTYSKKTQVEPSAYLSNKEDLKGIIIEYKDNDMPWFPRYYLNKKVPIFRLPGNKDKTLFKDEVKSNDSGFPNYLFFYGATDIENRVLNIEKLFNISLILKQEIEPDLIDKILHTLNPRNNINLTSYIYKITSLSSHEVVHGEQQNPAEKVHDRQ